MNILSKSFDDFVLAHEAAGRFYVPRQFMPQVDEKDIPELIAYALADKVDVGFDVIAPKDLHAHQRVSHSLAERMPDEVMMKPILVSSDNYVIDGNHRWWAHVHQKKEPMLAIKLGLPFNAAIDWVFSLPKTYSLDTESRMRN